MQGLSVRKQEIMARLYISPNSSQGLGVTCNDLIGLRTLGLVKRLGLVHDLSNAMWCLTTAGVEWVCEFQEVNQGILPF